MSARLSARQAEITRPAADVTEAVQDYAKAIYSLAERGTDAVSTSALAERLQVSPASASAMVKRLETIGLASHEPYHGVRLTAAGERVALAVIRHHRLLELYLSEALGLPWDRVHEEAEVLEHAISPELSDRIEEVLGHPTRDPHGDPIPTADGEIRVTPTRPLSDFEPGEAGTFVRVSDSDPEMLRYLSSRGISPGDRFEVVAKEPFDGPISVRFGDDVHLLGGGLTRAMRTEVSP
jgi:DtxR family transcriptional regulator, Mn-dependent transcriptional regulator